MKKYRFACRTILLLALMLPLVTDAGIRAAAAAAPPAYTVTELGTLGGTSSHGYGINDSGQVTGVFDDHAFVWTPTTPNGVSGTLFEIGTLSGTSSSGFDISESGLVTGAFVTSSGFEHAFLYDGTMHDLGTLGGISSYGIGINDAGQVTGVSGRSVPNSHAFLYDGTIHDLGALPDRSFSSGIGINSSGQITGIAGSGAMLWTPTTPNAASGTMHLLDPLGRSSDGQSINDSGQVTGDFRPAGGDYHAFLWTPTTLNGANGTMQDLGSLGGTYAVGYGINASAQVIGLAWLTGDTGHHAFLSTSGSGMVDLNSLIDPLSGWELLEANGINDAGQITGSGRINGEQHAFLLTPVPEPATWMLFCLGFVAVAVRRAGR